MTNEEILKNAIKKAIQNGYHEYQGNGFIRWIGEADESYCTFLSSEGPCDLIFSHDFAKAFWGEEIRNGVKLEDRIVSAPEWKYHLQQMVLEEDPIKYLEKFL